LSIKIWNNVFAHVQMVYLDGSHSFLEGINNNDFLDGNIPRLSCTVPYFLGSKPFQTPSTC
jgi:hypothetical protein